MADIETANFFWEHPYGDDTAIPCTHVVFEHPGGDTVTVPCTHGLVRTHPAGDPVTRRLAVRIDELLDRNVGPKPA